MAELKINVSGQNEASGVLDQVNNSLINLGHSFVARVAEGVLLRDMMHELINAGKEAITAFPELVEHTIKVGDQLYEMSLKTGASVENLSALRFVASQTGIDFESFNTTLFKMEQALGSSGSKAVAMQDELDRLHLNLKTLKDEKPDQAFIDIMSALEALPNRADQANIGMAIFGRGFKDMAGLTQESITGLIKEAHDLGLVMTTETAAAAHVAEIGMKSFEMQIESAGMKIGASVLPAVSALTRLFQEEFVKAMTEASGHTIDMDKVIVNVTQTLLKWADVGISVAQFIDDAFQGTKAIFFDMTAKVVDLANAFVHLLELGADLAAKTPLVGKEFLGVRDALKDTNEWLGGFSKGLHDESENALDAAAKHREFFGDLHTGLASIRDGFPEAFKTAKDEIADFAQKSHDAYGGVSTDADELSQKQKDAAASVRDEIKKIQDQTISDQQEYQLKGLALQLAKLDAQETNEQDAWQKRFDTRKINATQLADALAAIDDKYLAARANATATADEKRLAAEDKIAEGISKVWDDAAAAQEELGLHGLALTLAQLDRRAIAEKDAATKSITNEVDRVAMLIAIDAKYNTQRAVETEKSAQATADKLRSLDEGLASERAKLTGDTLKAQLDANQKALDDALAKDDRQYGYDQQMRDKEIALAKEKAAGIIAAHDQVYQAVIKLQQDLHENWVKTFDDTLVKTHSFKDAFVSVFDLLKSDVESIFTNLLGSILKGFLQPLMDQVSGVASSISRAISGALSGAGSSATSYIAGDIANVAGVGSGAAIAGGTGLLGAGLVSGLATAGIGAAVAGGIALAEHFFGPSEESKVVNPERDSWFAQHGNLRTVNEAVQGVTGNVALTQAVFDAKTDAEFKRATQAIHDAGVPGFIGGTGGAFVDFGERTRVDLHGKERIMTEREGKGVEDRLDALAHAHRTLASKIENMLAIQPMLLRHAVRGT